MKAAMARVYFSIEKIPGCVCTTAVAQTQLRRNEGGRAGQKRRYAKESVADFALWKARVPEDGDVFWKSESLGEGRPGWHIECSAMSMRCSAKFYLHLGGEDLIFPHHETKSPKAKARPAKPFVKHWLHGAFLLVEGKKMSKSLGNF